MPDIPQLHLSTDSQGTPLLAGARVLQPADHLNLLSLPVAATPKTITVPDGARFARVGASTNIFWCVNKTMTMPPGDIVDGSAVTEVIGAASLPMIIPVAPGDVLSVATLGGTGNSVTVAFFC